MSDLRPHDDDAGLDARLREALAPRGDTADLKSRILRETRRQEGGNIAPLLPRGWAWMGLTAGAACLAVGIFTGSHLQPADSLSGMEADIANLTFATNEWSDQ